MCLLCYQSDDSRHSQQRTKESQILFEPWCHWYTRKTTVDREQCPAAHKTKQVPTKILLHWLQPFVACCTEMNQSILKFFHLCHIQGIKYCPLKPEVLWPWKLSYFSTSPKSENKKGFSTSEKARIMSSPKAISYWRIGGQQHTARKWLKKAIYHVHIYSADKIL